MLASSYSNLVISLRWHFTKSVITALIVDKQKQIVLERSARLNLDPGRGDSLLLGHWYEIMALYYVKLILTEISASRQDRRVLQKSKVIRIEFLSKWGMLQTSRYV